jgi:polysaccharide biosynthesis/export protein
MTRPVMHASSNVLGRGIRTVFLTCLVACLMAPMRAQEAVQPTPIATPVTESKESVDMPRLTYRAPRSEDRYRLGAGDTVVITVFRYPELSRSVRIDGAGTIRLPLIHSDIQASCLTTDELAAEVAKRYLDYLRDPQVDASIKDYSSEPVAVVGSVNKPGSFELQRRVRLREILAFAGGPSPTAGKIVQILHDDTVEASCQPPEPRVATQDSKSVTTAAAVPATPPATADSSTGGITSLDLVALMRGGATDPYVRPGDVVNVPEADSAFVVGDVYRPSVVPLNKQITVSRAIALAGGLTPNAKSSKIRIVRYINGKGGNTEIVINLKDIYANKSEDLALQAGDIVQVPDSTTKTLIRALVWLGAWWGVYNAYNIIQ